MTKAVTEDWSYFNRAAEKRIAEVYRSRGTQPPLVLVPPTPPLPSRSATGLPSSPTSRWLGWLGILIAALAALWLIVLLTRYLTGTGLVAPVEMPPAEVKEETTAPAAPVPSLAEEPPPTVVTNFTTFQTVTFRHGSVVTGWNYASNTDRVPSYQFCYFVTASPDASGASNKFNIENRPGRVFTYDEVRTDEIGLTADEWRKVGGLCRWNTQTAPTPAPETVPPRPTPGGRT